MASFQLSTKHCEKIPCPLSEWVLPHVEKILASTDSEKDQVLLSDATAAAEATDFHLNLLLEREIQRQQKTVLTIVNRLLEDIPHIFPKRDVARQFHDLIINHLMASGATKAAITEKENSIQLPPIPPVDIPMDFMHITGMVARCPLEKLKHLSKTKAMEKMLQETDHRDNWIVLHADAQDALKSLTGLSENLPDCLFFMKKATVKIGDRTFRNVNGHLKIQSGLRMFK